MIKNYIFDFDGTLVDTFPLIKKIIIDLLPEKYSPSFIKDSETLFHHLGLKPFIQSLHVNPLSIPKFVFNVNRQRESHINEVIFFKDIKKLLLPLKKQNKILGILTGNSVSNTQNIIDQNGLNYFDFVHSEKNLFGKAPNLKKIINKYQLKKSETVYIGDEIRDIEAAKKVGITSVAVTWGFNSEKLLKSANPDYIVTHPLDILNIK